MNFIDSDYYDKEIPKYRKKRKKKNVKKSDHKHQYIDVLIRRKNKESFWYSHGKVCKVCGRIGEERYFETEEVEGKGYFRCLTQEELLEKYKDLPIFEK